MNIYKLISGQIKQKLQTIPELAGVSESAWDNVVIEVPKNRDFGDFSTNVAMVLTRELQKNPRQIADMLLSHIRQIDGIQDVEKIRILAEEWRAAGDEAKLKELEDVLSLFTYEELRDNGAEPAIAAAKAFLCR